MLDNNILNNLKSILPLMVNPVTVRVSLDETETSKEMIDMLSQISELSNLILIKKEKLERTPSFEISSENNKKVVFAGIPSGHEFNSFVLALIQVSGKPPKITDGQKYKIESIKEKLHFETYISLTCHNCPEVVQSLNIMSVLNDNISNVMIDGAVFQKEVNEKEIMAVPSVYLNGKLWGSGRMDLDEILNKLESYLNVEEEKYEDTFDVLIVGGGPAGASSAIYSARKGLKTGIVADRFGGQVLDTVGIENFISNKKTEGLKLARQLEEHVSEYDVKIIKNKKAINIEKIDNIFFVELNDGNFLKSKSIILSTGASWRQLGVKGENELKNKGVAYCPHCDGPLFKGKNVAVVGGGNSGVEAAIDLAGIVSHVTLIEFNNELKADAVLQQKLRSLENVKIIVNAQVKEVLGVDKVTGIRYSNRMTEEMVDVHVDGIFVQIGLLPNTLWLKDKIQLTKFNEIIIDQHGATNVPGIFAAGDCTNTPYKQIIIAMGAGATASLSAFDYLIRN